MTLSATEELTKTNDQEPTGASFPMDNPQNTKEGGKRLGEIDLYLGPSYSNVQGIGIGYNASVYTQDASPKSFGFKKAAIAGGGVYYDSTNHPAFEPQVTGIGKFAWGYYSLEGMKDGFGPHVLLDFLMINLSYLGDQTSSLSYTPAIELGLHGRVASTKTFWAVQLEPSVSFSYNSGALTTISNSGQAQYTMIAPLFIARAFLDTPLSSKQHLRLGGYIYETFDNLGKYGSRQMTQIVAFGLIKFGSWFYTGPQFIYYNADKVANLSTRQYLPATAEYSISWLLGGALAAL